MNIVLIHGMGRTPLSMLMLSQRLRKEGHSTRLFGYSPTLESFEPCQQRLIHFIQRVSATGPYALIGHSLGCVLIRSVLTHLQEQPPAACFFLAPPSQACKAAKFFADNPLYRLLMGEMGQLLANEPFMEALPIPTMPTRVYAGTGGPIGKLSPFGDIPNDGILTVEEVQGALPNPVILMPSAHTFIMYSRQVADDIAHALVDMQHST